MSYISYKNFNKKEIQKKPKMRWLGEAQAFINETEIQESSKTIKKKQISPQKHKTTINRTTKTSSKRKKRRKEQEENEEKSLKESIYYSP